MIRFARFGLMSLVLLGMTGSAVDCHRRWRGRQQHSARQERAEGSCPPPPSIVNDPIRLTPEGLRLGMTVDEVYPFYNKVLDQDYVASTSEPSARS